MMDASILSLIVVSLSNIGGVEEGRGEVVDRDLLFALFLLKRRIDPMIRSENIRMIDILTMSSITQEVISWLDSFTETTLDIPGSSMVIP